MTPPNTVSAEFKNLLKQSSHYSAGVGGGIALGFISFPIFTRVFSVADYGTIDLLQKLLLVLTAISKLGLQNSALRFYNAKEFAAKPEMARRFYSTMFFGMAAAAAFITVVFIVGVRVTPPSMISASLAGALLVVSLLISLRSLESMFWSFLRLEERTAAYNIISVALKAATIASVCLLIFWRGPSPQMYLSGVIGVELIIVLIFTVSLLRRRLLHFGAFDASLYRQSVAFGAPLIVYELASLVLDSGDRVLVRQYLGAEALGLYSVAYGLSSYVNELLVTPLGLAIVPMYMKLWTHGSVEGTTQFLSTTFDVFLMVAVGVVAAMATVSRELLIVLASAKYSAAGGLIPIITAGVLLYATYIFLSAGLLIHKRTLAMAKILTACAIVNVALNCLLLPRIGLQGAALATLASYGLCVVLLARASFRVLRLNIDAKACFRYVCAAVLAWMISSQVSVSVPVINLICKAVIVVACYCGLLYVLDIRVRQWIAQLFDRAGQPGESGEVILEVEETEVAP